MNPTESISIKPEGIAWLETPLSFWEQAISKMSMQDRQELERWLGETIQRAALLTGYLQARGTLGCGDSGHQDGVRQGNRVMARVRKSLGYTFPNSRKVKF